MIIKIYIIIFIIIHKRFDKIYYEFIIIYGIYLKFILALQPPH